MSTAALDDYLDELLAEAMPAPVVAAVKPATLPTALANVPGDSAELEAAFEEALAAMQSKPESSAEPSWDDVPAEVPLALADTAAGNTPEPTWDDLPDEVIYETGPAESAKLAHADSPALQSAFDVAAGVTPPLPTPIPPMARAPTARAQPGAARPNSWQELQAQAHTANGPQQRRASERASRWLRLRCGQQTYALELLKVQEVVLPVPLLALRGTDASMLGIMNLRGQVVPVMDLCLHLDMAATAEDPQTRIVVLEENGEVLGLRVSAVEDVASLTDSQIEPPDTARICQISNELFRGIARVGSQPMILLDATRLLQ
ncbi:chemotaxis protein CheW [Stenotrophomonas sp. Iso1]|uniref:chemotaxis protein CheW n=1 Tax=Stenotrophomonas sp. Iso1 TaxID=2977283 RepID=UPI0022B7C40A|nr:chemotaxis protein CheW [Stenotrophomonas sp. Iso1]